MAPATVRRRRWSGRGRAVSLAKTAGDVAEAPLLGEDGGTTDAIGVGRQALKQAKKVVKALEAV